MSITLLSDFRVEEKEDLKTLISQIKPSWPLDRLKIQTLIGGYSHRMYQCINQNSNNSESITVRIRDIFEISPLTNQEFEVKVLENLYARGLFPKLYATFQNGYAYEYIKGQVVFNTDYITMDINDRTLKLIAQKMSSIHSIKMSGENYLKDTSLIRLEEYVKKHYPEDPPKAVSHMTKARILKDILTMKEKAMKLDVPLVLCHGDCHTANMIYNEKKDDIVFVDFEWTHIGYQPEDIAFFLQVLDINELTFENLNITVPLNHERKFLFYYLENWYKKKYSNKTVTEEDVDQFQEHVRLFRLMSTLFVFVIHVSCPDLGTKLTNDHDSLLQNLVKLYYRIRRGVL